MLGMSSLLLRCSSATRAQAGRAARAAATCQGNATYPALFKEPRLVPSAPKYLVFVRHAQAMHNVFESLQDNPDNPLTAAGREQALEAGRGPLGAILRDVDLVVTTPLTRAMETTQLLLESAGAEGVRVRVHPMATERWSARCDEGTSRAELWLGLSDAMRGWEGWEELPEEWWAREGDDAVARAADFAEWARSDLKEDRIAFVGHGGFWETLLGHYMSNIEHMVCERSLN